MAKALHIFNGSSTKSIFEKSGLTGESFIWMEMLCSGPCLSSIHNREFWNNRAQFINEEYGGSNYHSMMTDTLEAICWQDYEEVMFWFEYDLFCLVNFTAAIHYVVPKYEGRLTVVDLRSYQTNPAKSILALGEIEPTEYPSILKNRISITQEDIVFAQQFWLAYSSSSDPKHFIETCDYASSVFPFLKEVLPYHLYRIPDYLQYSKMDKDILSLLQTKSDIETLKELLQTKHLGYGDLQWQWHINRLQEHQCSLDTNPMDKSDWFKLYDYYLGGYHLNQFHPA